jgi:hypothetical protein
MKCLVQRHCNCKPKQHAAGGKPGHYSIEPNYSLTNTGLMAATLSVNEALKFSWPVSFMLDIAPRRLVG